MAYLEDLDIESLFNVDMDSLAPYIPQVPSTHLSEDYSVTPHLHNSSRYQEQNDRGEGAVLRNVASHAESQQQQQQQQYQFLSKSIQQHHPLNIHHHQHSPMSQEHVYSTNCCPVHSNNESLCLHAPQQHPILHQQLPQQPVPHQQLPQQPVLHRPWPHFHHSLVQPSEHTQPIIPTDIVFPPIIQQLQKKGTTGKKQVLIPVPLSRTNNTSDSSKDPSVPATHVPSLPLTPVPSLPPTPVSSLLISPDPSLPPIPVHSLPLNPPETPLRDSCRFADIDGIRRLRLFADRFKESLMKYDLYSKQHVAQQITIRYNFEMTEEKLSLFENKLLSLEEMSVMKSHLEKWLLDTLRTRGVSETEVKELSQWLTSFNQRRRKRTAIPLQAKKQLLNEFENNPKPSVEALNAIAEKLHLNFEVVRVWFCNKRAKRKAGRDNDPEDDEEIEEELDNDDEGISGIQSSQ